MQALKKCFTLIILGSFIWCAVSAARPYWDKIWLERHIEAVAIYGTKNSVGETKERLNKELIEVGFDVDPEALYVEKDENNNCRIIMNYLDEINIFGHILKQLEFTVEVTAKEVTAF